MFPVVIACAALAVLAVASYVLYRVWNRYRFLPRLVFGRVNHDTGPYVDLVTNAVMNLAPCRASLRDLWSATWASANGTTSPAAPANTVFGISFPLDGSDLRRSPQARQTVTYFVTGLDEAAGGAVDDVISWVFRKVLSERLARRPRLPGEGWTGEVQSDPRWAGSWLKTWTGLDDARVIDTIRAYGPDVVVQVAETPVSVKEAREAVLRSIGDDEMTRRVTSMAERLSVMEASWRLYGVAMDLVQVARDRAEIVRDTDGSLRYAAGARGRIQSALQKVKQAIDAAAGTDPTATSALAYLRSADATVVAGVYESWKNDADAVSRAGRKYRSDLMLALTPAPETAPESVRSVLNADKLALPVVTGGVPWGLDLAVSLRVCEVLLASGVVWEERDETATSELNGTWDQVGQKRFGPCLAAVRGEVYLLVAKHKAEGLHVAFMAFEREVVSQMYRRACLATQTFLEITGGSHALVDAHSRGVHDLFLAATYLSDALRVHRLRQRPKVGDVLSSYANIARSMLQNWPLSVLFCNYDKLNPRAYWSAHRSVLSRMSGNAVAWLTTFMDFPENLLRRAVCEKTCA